EPWYSPSSSTPSASRGTLASSGVPSGSGIGAGRSVLTCPAATVMGLLLPRVLTWGCREWLGAPGPRTGGQAGGPPKSAWAALETPPFGRHGSPPFGAVRAGC